MRRGLSLLARAISLCVLFYPLAATAEATLPVPAGVHLAGVLPIPLSLVQRAEPYTRFKSSTLLDWHPKTSAALILAAAQPSGTEQLHLVAGSGATSELLIAQGDRVVEARFHPVHGYKVLVRTIAAGGESTLSLLEIPSRKLSRISPAGESAGMGAWNTSGDRVVFTTSTSHSKIYIGDPQLPDRMKLITSAEPGKWRDTQFSPDGKTLVYVQEGADADHVWIHEMETTKRRRITQAAPPTRYGAPRFSSDGSGLWLTARRAPKPRQLIHLDLGTGAESVVTTSPSADVVEFAISAAAKRIAVNATENGSSVLRFFDLVSRKELLRPALLPGEITGIHWMPIRSPGDDVNQPATGAPVKTSAGFQLGFGLASSRAPQDLFVYDIETTKLVRWTNGAVPGLNAFEFVEPSPLSWKIDENRSAKADLYLPDPTRFPGRRPVLVVLPATNAMDSPRGFIGRYHFLLNELGIAVCYPGVTGTTHSNMSALIDRLGEQAMLNADRVILQASPSDDLQTFVSLLRLPRIAGGVFIGDKPSPPISDRAPVPLFVVHETHGRLTPDSTWQISIGSTGAASAPTIRNFVFYAQLRFMQLIAGQSELLPDDKTLPHKQPL
jgi:hypothetical protein